jgi:hypothetical protein
MMTMPVLVRRVIVLAVLAAPSLASAQAPSQEKTMQEMMERMKEAATPGLQHKALADYVGTWDVQMAMVMPGAPPQRSTGTAEYRWVIDGRWLSQHLTGTLMGGPYESFVILGFDNYAKNHVSVSVSSMDTAMNMARGLVVDPAGKTTAVYGTLDEYTTGELHKPYKVVMRNEGPARHVMEVWDLGIGVAGAKVLEFTFTRRKQAAGSAHRE